MSLPLVVLAAGLSTRYGGLKQLDPLGPGGEAIMDYNVFDAARAGFDSVTFVVRPEILDDVREHVTGIIGDSLPISYVCQELTQLPAGFRAPPDRKKPWGTAHAVLCAAEGKTESFAVCNADDLYGPEAFQLLHDHLAQEPMASDAALVGYRLADTLSGSGGVARGICLLRRHGSLEHVAEVREIRQRHGWITGVESVDAPVELTGDETVSMNLWGLTKPVIELMRRQFTRFLEHWGANTAREFFLSTAVNGQIQIDAARVHVLHAPASWFGITHAADRARSQAILLERVAAGVYPNLLAEGLPRLV